MNPVNNLADQVKLARSILRPERLGLDENDNEAMLDEAEELARLVLAYDAWCRSHGSELQGL